MIYNYIIGRLVAPRIVRVNRAMARRERSGRGQIYKFKTKQTASNSMASRVPYLSFITQQEPSETDAAKQRKDCRKCSFDQ